MKDKQSDNEFLSINRDVIKKEHFELENDVICLKKEVRIHKSR